MTTCELRKKAAQVIQERGWCQGNYVSPNGACCTIGALVIANDGLVTNNFLIEYGPTFESRQAFRDALDQLGFHSLTERAVEWNDAPGRTQAEVIARLLDGCEGGEDR